MRNIFRWYIRNYSDISSCLDNMECISFLNIVDECFNIYNYACSIQYDLRNRIILLRYGEEQSTQEVANNIHLSRQTVLRVCNGFGQHQRLGRPAISHFLHPYVFVLLEYVLKRPSCILFERDVVLYIRYICGGQFNVVSRLENAT